MDPELVLELLGDFGPASSGTRDADLRRILNKLDELLSDRGADLDDELPSEAIHAWLDGELVAAVSLLQKARSGLSVTAATALLLENLGADPVTRLIERRVDRLRRMDAGRSLL